MEVLCFKISGKLAHFRKYYANNTAFSFSIPPRTTLMGIVAAAMGWERDSYYEKLASENIHFGVRVLSPLKKAFHRLNFLSIKTLGDLSKKLSSDFRGEGGRIQTPFEVVSGWNLPKDEVAYQVFVTPTTDGETVFKELKNHFINGYPVFNITLGVADFSAYISELRIDLCVDKLKNDQTFRKYTMNAIAHEIGFNNAESFSKAFHRRTGIYPSYFIRELEKKHETRLIGAG